MNHPSSTHASKLTVLELVKIAYLAAKANDYDMSDYTDNELACDMLAYDADIEESGYTEAEVTAAVTEVRRAP